MDILILGGTGAIGKPLISEFIKTPDVNVYITSRRDMSNLSTDRIQYIQCNAKNDDVLKQLLECKTYYSIIDFLIYETEDFERRYMMLCKACSHYIFLSSCRVLAASDARLNEDSARLIDVSTDDSFLKTEEYSLIKAKEENVLMKGMFDNWTIVRPYITYNTKRLQLGIFEKEWWLYRAIHGRKILFSKEIGEKYTTLTYADDVAKVIANIVIGGKCKKEIIHPVSSKEMRWKDILDIYCDTLEDILGRRPEIVWIESIDSKLPGASRYNYYQIKYDRAIDRLFDNRKVKLLMPDSFSFIDPKVGLRECLTQFVKEPEFGEILWKMQAYTDIVCKDKTPISEIDNTSMKAKYLIWRYTPYLRIIEKGIR